MKKLYSLIFFFLTLVLCDLNGQTNPNFELHYAKPTPTYPNTSEFLNLLGMTLEEAEERRENEIKKCYLLIIMTFRKLVENGDAEYDFVEPASSWIERLEYYENKESDLKVCVLIKKNSQEFYVFNIDKTIWTNWKNSISKGEFYNEYIRDNPLYSYRPFCESLIDENDD